MHLDVIGMPVTTVGVVDRDDIGLLFLEDVGQLSRGRIHIGIAERVGVVVLDGPRHPRVRIVQHHHTVGAEH